MDRLTEGTHTHPMAMNFWYQTLFNAGLSCFMLDIYLQSFLLFQGKIQD